MVLILCLVVAGASVLGACGSNDESSSGNSESNSTESTAVTSDGGDDVADIEPTGNAKVDEYCDRVAAFVKKNRTALENPDSADAAAIGRESQELADLASELAEVVAKDPSLSANIAACNKQLEQLGGGPGPS
jgi:hypothetical protein